MTDEPSYAISVRVKHRSQSRYAGQRRHDLRIGPQPKYVDGDRSHGNRVLVEPPTPAPMRKRAEDLRSQVSTQREMKSSAAVATIGIITFGAAAQPIFDALDSDAQDAAYLAVAQRIAEEYDTKLSGLVIHADEASPHAHAVWESRAADGTAMSKIMRGSRIQDIASEVISDHAPGIVRGVRKADRIERGDDASRIHHRSVRELHRDLPADLEAARARVVEMEGRVEKARAAAQGDDEKAEKASRRLATYEKRLADRQADFDRLDAQVAELEQRAADLDVREAALDRRASDLNDRDLKVKDREQRLRSTEAMFDRTYRKVKKLIGEAATTLGVGDTLVEIERRLRRFQDSSHQPEKAQIEDPFSASPEDPVKDSGPGL